MQQSGTGSREDRTKGFSLAEVLVAVALLSVIILALFGLVTAGVRQAYGGKKMTQGTIVARNALERVNVERAPQTILGAANTDSTATRTWTRSGTGVTESGGTTGNATIRTAISNMLRDSDLPSAAGAQPSLTVTMTAVPGGTNFTTASMVRIVVDLTWWEWGRRRRQVRLQALNLKVVP